MIERLPRTYRYEELSVPSAQRELPDLPISHIPESASDLMALRLAQDALKLISEPPVPSAAFVFNDLSGEHFEVL